MTSKLRSFIFPALIAVFVASTLVTSTRAATPDSDARKSLDAFNQAFVHACQTMDHGASGAMWADDGVDLLPGMPPLVGKPKIVAWLNSLTPQLAGAKMVYCTVDWQDVQVHGDLAYEWGFNRQKIEFPPPQKAFASDGKITLILKRQPDGAWKIALESWNSNPEPEQKP